MVVNTGNMLFNGDTLDPAKADEAKVEADVLIQASLAMGIRLGGIGTCDMAATADFLMQHSSGQNKQNFLWLSTNLVHPGHNKPLFTPLHINQIGGVKVAILSVVNHNKLPPWERGRAYLAKPWQDSLAATLPQAEKMADLIVLLSNYPYEENRKIANTFSTIDLIFQSGQNSAMYPTVVNKSLITNSDSKGKHLAVLTIDWHGKGFWSAAQAGMGSTSPTDQQVLSPSIFQQQLMPVDRSLREDGGVRRIINHGLKGARDTQHQAQ